MPAMPAPNTLFRGSAAGGYSTRWHKDSYDLQSSYSLEEGGTFVMMTSPACHFRNAHEVSAGHIS